MRELGFVVGFITVAALIASGAGAITRFGALELGWALLVGVGGAAVGCELVYFAGLWTSLRRNGELPERWYARSFEHHRLMTTGQRWLVLPFFWLGFVGLMVALLIGIVLVIAAIHTFFAMG